MTTRCDGGGWNGLDLVDSADSAIERIPLSDVGTQREHQCSTAQTPEIWEIFNKTKPKQPLRRVPTVESVFYDFPSFPYTERAAFYEVEHSLSAVWPMPRLTGRPIPS